MRKFLHFFGFHWWEYRNPFDRTCRVCKRHEVEHMCSDDLPNLFARGWWECFDEGEKQFKQGSVSVLFGCHSPIHSFLVVLAWRKLYKKFPSWWQVCCIFLHDIGHWGLNYLDDYELKKKHWQLGAEVAGKLFGDKGFFLCAGHSSCSGFPRSELYKADKYSWHLAPKFWLMSNCVFEPKLRMGYSISEAVSKFKDQVKESVETGSFRSTHSMYMKRCER